MVNWIYKNKKLEEVPKDMFGFVYKISSKGYFYIGSKQFFSITNPKISKKRSNELYTGRGAKKKKERVVKESNWKTYISSSNTMKTWINSDGINNFKFEILSIHKTKYEMALNEALRIIQGFLKDKERIMNEWVSIRYNCKTK